MHTRDLIVDEFEKMARLIAKLLGLKSSGTHGQFEQEFNNILQSEYDIELESLLNLSEADFITNINTAEYSSEKLNALGQMLYVFAEPFEQNEDTQQLLKKVMAILDVLEEKYHIQSFDNITRRNAIYRYFNINYE